MTTPGASNAHYLTLMAAGALFAIPIARIREVIQCPRITRMPLAPALLPGVINLRGAVVPVLDLAARLECGRTVIGKRTCVVVIEVEMESGLGPLGMLVDGVEAAIDAASDMLEARPAFGAGIRQDFQSALLRVGSRFVSVLDVDSVAAPSELEIEVRDYARASWTALRKSAFAG